MSLKRPKKRTQADIIDAIGNTVAGTVLIVDKHLNANNTTDIINCFQVFVTVEVYRLYGIVTDNTVLNNCTEVWFDLWDGVKSDPITANQAVLSGANVKTHFNKYREPQESLVVLDNSECQVGSNVESNRLFSQFSATQKDGTDTYVRFRYTTTDTPIDAKVRIYALYSALDGGSLVAI